MTDVDRERPNLENPWLVGIGSSLAVVVIVAVAGPVLEWPVWQIALLVGVPVLLGALGYLGVRLRRRGRERREEFLRVWERVEVLERRLAEHALGEVVAEAVRRGWQFAHISGGFTLTSPDDDVVTVDYLDINPYSVATELRNASPHHFPDEWLPPVVSQTTLAVAMGTEARAGFKSLDERVARLENPTGGRALADAMARRRASIRTSDRPSN